MPMQHPVATNAHNNARQISGLLLSASRDLREAIDLASSISRDAAGTTYTDNDPASPEIGMVVRNDDPTTKTSAEALIASLTTIANSITTTQGDAVSMQTSLWSQIRA